MKHAVIVAHPNPHSFNLTMARAYQRAVEAVGGTCVLRDLYHLGFDPRLGDHEIPRPKGFEPGDDVKVERALIGDSDVFVFIYPLWLDAPPAMMKGYMERVFGLGFAYKPGDGGEGPMLTGRSMISISSSGAPLRWVKETGDWAALSKLFDEHFAAVCGLTVLEHLHFGEITPGVSKEIVEDCGAQVRAMVEQTFHPST